MMTYGKKFSLIGTLAVSLVALSACETINKADRNYEAVERETETNVAVAKRPFPVAQHDNVSATDNVYLGNRSFRAMRGNPLPADTNSITLISVTPMDIYTIATEINSLTGIPVVIEGDAAFSGGGGPGGGADFEDAGEFGQLDEDPFGQFGAGDQPGAEQFGQIIGSAPSLRGVATNVNYTGTLEGLMNFVSTAFGVEWIYEEGEIRIQTTVTRTFTLNAFSGEGATQILMSTDVAASGSAGDDGAEATSTQNIAANFDYTVDAWGEIESNVVSLLPEGSAVGLSPSAGTITVTAPVWAMRRVEDYVDELNMRYNRQIVLNVDVLSVTLTEDDDYQFDTFLQGILFDGDFAVDIGEALDTGSFANTVANTVVTLQNPNNVLTGSQVAVGALSALGEVSVVQSVSLTTLNGRPVPLSAVNQETYISGVEEEEDEETGNVTRSFETDVFTTGFTMTAVPRILSDGNLILQYGINIADGSLALCEGAEDEGITCPNVEISSTMQQLTLGSNQTAVVAGFEQNSTNRIRQGTGTPDNMLLGGRQQGEVDRRMFVVLITPRIHDRARSVAAIQ
ncbi:MAG: hypothetical protein Alpg2KO_02020 [Alphaproteobacteria bacterium]